jgi:hypothetical protein
MHALECWSKTIIEKYDFRIEIVCPQTVACGILFTPPLVVVNIFVRVGMKSTSVSALEPAGCKLGGVATASGFLKCGIER